MWILTPLQPGGETHYLHSSRDYVVGRKSCDILLANDQSISRAHAQLKATDQTLTLTDTSKYGTIVNSQRLAENMPVDVSSGDCITFGAFNSKFTVDHLKLEVCSSCLDTDGKATLTQALQHLEGKLVSSWSQACSHLAMPTVKVTIKTIAALLCCRPIVKPEFFSEFRTAAQQKLAPPDADRFIPEIDEPTLNKEDVNLRANPRRTRLFSGLTFVFLSARQLKRLSAAVGFGGGGTRLLEEGSLPRELLESGQSCVVDVATASSQAQLASSTSEWANSVKRIVERKGLRVITESEIGLAAIYASCDKYCNPSSSLADSEPKVKPRIPSASLSQSVAVDETVLPVPSQNITAFALNTETSQRTEPCDVTGVRMVGETPEKKPNHSGVQPGRGKPMTQTASTHFTVAETPTSSCSAAEKTHLQKTKPEFRPTVSGALLTNGNRSQFSQPKPSEGPKTFPQKQSPRKPKPPVQVSPQKQSSLTSFFQPVNKKRPLEDDFSAVTTQAKRPVHESSISVSASDSEALWFSEKAPTAVPETPSGSSAGRPVTPSAVVPSRKRKDMEVIQMDELESIMSEDMDAFDEPPARREASRVHSLSEQKRAEPPMPSHKKPRTDHEEESKISNQRAHVDTEAGKLQSRSVKTEQHVMSIKTEKPEPPPVHTAHQHSGRAASSVPLQPFEDDEDLELLEADVGQAEEEEAAAPPQPAVVKQEARETKIDEDAPDRPVLVEFRSLAVSALPKAKAQPASSNGHTKNFKCFRKRRVPGTGGSPHVIGGSDLLAHNRGQNTDLDEWLRDAAEEERQTRRDQTIGDDLFRYNPTTLTRRR